MQALQGIPCKPSIISDRILVGGPDFPGPESILFRDLNEFHLKPVIISTQRGSDREISGPPKARTRGPPTRESGV